MGHISYKDHALIKRWQASKKMNANEKLKDEKNGVIVESCFRLYWRLCAQFEASICTNHKLPRVIFGYGI
jgi:hypothetical protein